MVIKNSDNYYINAVCNNLKPFEDLKKKFLSRAADETRHEQVFRVVIKLQRRASGRVTILSAIVMASTWSWVT